MKIKLIIPIMLVAAFCSVSAHARPVSYAQGWMAMTTNDGEGNSAMLLYSPTATFSLGPFLDHDRDSDGELAGLQANYLFKRWNGRDSQGNFYLLSGAGVASSSDDKDLGGYAGLELDWEDRRYYISYESRYTFAHEVKDEFEERARVGIAPYVAEYGGIHTWLMLQADHRPEDDNEVTLTPLVRVFKGDYLGEAGINNQGEVLFNLTITY